MLDYPGKAACVVFTPGCNFRCGYCHNPEFVLPERIAELKNSFIPEEVFFNFLRERQGVAGAQNFEPLLDGVVVTGGEPTLMPDLLDFLGKIKSLGFLAKLDTNGNRPQVLSQALERGVVDYVAMDVKTSLEEYPNLVGKLVKPENISQSIGLLKQSGIPHEFRSTLIKETHPRAVLESMAVLMRGAERLYLQSFRSGTTLQADFERYHAFTSEEMTEIAQLFRKEVKQVVIR